MEDYLEVLPNDLIKVLIYVSNINLLKYISSSKDEIINDDNFWVQLIKHKMPDLNYKVVPQYLYNYKDMDRSSAIYNFIKLFRSYRTTTEKLKQRSWKSGQHTINIIPNLELIPLLFRGYIGTYGDSFITIFEIVVFNFSSRIDFYSKGRPVSAIMDRRQLFDLYLCLIINGHFQGS